MAKAELRKCKCIICVGGGAKARRVKVVTKEEGGLAITDKGEPITLFAAGVVI